ncbi:FAD dependent oxidoreductase [Paenibacillus sp. UNCCL117]|uniref:FAD-dependent oxidoreductase n=1 Tax=unclassified Paenibacillus TaxID=185978 RepID=UPI000891BD73|nr:MULTISPECIES: FAD-dependent oxidoreductase [unclassified Paenibacillus]SDD69352.1 FAD dependent oxidoreductase [Paenibacillus sp. cl123]SFW45123.1 FAD dependent oxidoreductase [Paenibacillus sp. UNCCL117]
MNYIEEPARRIPVVAEPDVLVVGGGPAGIGAAVAAARNGAKVLLIERYGFVGGNLTVAMVNPMFTFHDIQGKQVIRGVAGELVDRLVAKTVSPGHVTDLTFDNASMSPFDPEGMKLVLFELLEEAGVELMLHTTFADAYTDDQGRVTGVIVENKSGRQAIHPKLVIDCSADADVVARIGAPFVKGRESDGAMQPVTLFYRVAGVDIPGLKAWMKANRQLLKDAPTDEEIDAQSALAFLGMKEIIKQAMENGDYPKDAAPRILMYELPQQGQFAVNCTRLQGIDGTNVADLTRAEVETRKQAWAVTEFMKRHIGGFEQAYMLDTGVQVGVRETRHIVGDYTMTEDDVLSSRAFEDGIACGTFAIDIHPPEGEQQVFTGSGKAVYEIPYRSLLPQGVHNVLVAGRCISATHNAFGSVRVMATAMGIGQGAGTAGALAVKRGLTTREVDAGEVRRLLLEQGQYLMTEEAATVIDESLRLLKSDGSGGTASHHNPFAKQSS